MSKAKEKVARKSHKYTETEWQDKGTALFGDNTMIWEFKCPVCGNVQTPSSLKKYKDKGATPNSVYQECEGRFSGGKKAFSLDGEKGGKGCDYAAFGFLRLGDFVNETPVFPFNEVEET